MGLCARVCTRKSVRANLHTRLRMYGLARVSQYVRLAQGHGGAAVVFSLALTDSRENDAILEKHRKTP